MTIKTLEAMLIKFQIIKKLMENDDIKDNYVIETFVLGSTNLDEQLDITYTFGEVVDSAIDELVDKIDYLKKWGEGAL